MSTLVFHYPQRPLLATHDSSYNTRPAPTKVALPKNWQRASFPTVHAGAEAFLAQGLGNPKSGNSRWWTRAETGKLESSWRCIMWLLVLSLFVGLSASQVVAQEKKAADRPNAVVVREASITATPRM